jgi:hypothetical protein
MAGGKCGVPNIGRLYFGGLHHLDLGIFYYETDKSKVSEHSKAHKVAECCGGYCHKASTSVASVFPPTQACYYHGNPVRCYYEPLGHHLMTLNYGPGHLNPVKQWAANMSKFVLLPSPKGTMQHARCWDPKTVTFG